LTELATSCRGEALEGMSGTVKAAASCRTPKGFDFFGTDAENEPTLCRKRKGWGTQHV
jgi:hypothetical protein